MAGDIDKIERKLLALVASVDCPVCAERQSRCHHCGRPVGALPGEWERAVEMLDAALDELAARRRRLDSM